MAAYSTSRIVTQQTDEHTDRLLFYGEPTPECVGPLRAFLGAPGAAGFQKIILMETEERIQEVRPLAITALGDSATLTTALPGMLEVRMRRDFSEASLSGSMDATAAKVRVTRFIFGWWA